MMALLIALVLGSCTIGGLLFAIHHMTAISRDREKQSATIAQLRQRLDQLEEQIDCWQRYSNNPAIPEELYQVALELIDRLSVLDSNSFADSKQERILKAIEQVPGSSHRELTTTLPDTQAIGQFQNELRGIRRALHQRCSYALLQEDRYQFLAAEVSKVTHQVTINSYTDMARQAIDDKQVETAQRHLDQALKLLASAQPGDQQADSDTQAVEALCQQLTALQQASQEAMADP